ncbi:MAG TPA: peptidylprolyl isomerase [Bryobacteraceae bacterium]|nr:peptidylprolyl isomerase [Bryobacteraceae bacterium]
MKALTPVVVLVLMAIVGGCKKSIPADVAATVNGRPITYAELDKQYNLQFSGSPDRPAGDQMTSHKLEILRSLIDNEIMLQRAEKLGLMAADADVEQKFNELKAPYTQEEFQKQLDARKMTVPDLKAQIRRELSVQKLFNREITSKISISDKEIAEFYKNNRANFNLAEPQYHLLQIVVTTQPDPNVRNLKNDKAQNEQQATTKITALEARLRQGEDFKMLAQNFSEDPSSASGGDLGFVNESALEKANPEFRKMIAGMQPGQMSKIIRSGNEFRILKLESREPAGQRELNDPQVQQSIRELMLNRKDQVLRSAYYEVARNEAQVVNSLAAKIVAESGQSTAK